MEPPATCLFAPEIERNTVSILWRQPEYLPLFLRRINPAIHIRQLHLRIIIEAINTVYGDFGCADWALVDQCVRELGQLDECGGLEELSALYAAYEPGAYTEKIFSDYLGLLETYARAVKEEFPVARFTGGTGTLYPNIKRREGDPAFVGEMKIGGKFYSVNASYAGERIRIRILP